MGYAKGLAISIALIAVLPACTSNSSSTPRTREMVRSCPPGQTQVCHSRSAETSELPVEERTYDYCRCRNTDDLVRY